MRNLSNVRLLPDVPAGFLGVVAVAAPTYVLVSSARRRRGEFSVIRAMGMTRRSARSIVHAQSTVMGLFASVVGIRLGLVTGRSGWHVITEHVPLSDVAPLALVAVVLIVRRRSWSPTPWRCGRGAGSADWRWRRKACGPISRHDRLRPRAGCAHRSHSARVR